MRITKINIADGVYDRKLLEFLWQKKYDNEFNQELLELLQKLCKADLIKETNLCNNVLLTSKEKETLISIDINVACNNKEVVARWCDCIQELDRNKRPLCIKVCSTNYFQIYKLTENYEYLVRRLQLIRKAKNLFTTSLEKIYTSTKEEIIKSNAPFWQKKLITETVGIFGIEKCQQEFSVFMEEKIERYNQEEKFSDARFCIDSLYQLGSLTLNQCHIRKAESFEKEGDCIDGYREPNTWYPNLSETYLSGLKEISSIGECNNLKQRLKNKVKKTQKKNVEMIRSIGSSMIPTIDYEKVSKIISEMNIDSFETAFEELISIPIVSEGIINNYVNISKSGSSPLMEFFSQTVKVNSNGAKVALSTGDDIHINNARNFIREKCIAAIKGIKNIIDIHNMNTFYFSNIHIHFEI